MSTGQNNFRKKAFFFAKSFVSNKKMPKFAPAKRKRWHLRSRSKKRLGYGVIGNTTDSGPVILGSSPDIPTRQKTANHLVSGFFVCIIA